jgi:hypothetical protein
MRVETHRMTVKGRARRPGDRPRGASGLASGVAFLTLIAGAGRAEAHPEFSALGANRYITAAIFDGRVEITDALLEGALVSGEERRRLDADGDGRISDAELRAGEARLRAEGAALTVEVDGRALAAPLVVAIDLGDEPRATAAPLVVERRLSLPAAWQAGARRLRLSIAREPPRLLDTEVGVVLGPGLALAGGEDRVTFRGPRASALEERAATFEIVGPRPAAGGRVPRAGLAALALAILALGAGVSVAARRRARR